MFVYKVTNHEDKFLGMGADKNGIIKFVTDHVMICDNHADFKVHTGMKTEEGIKVIKVETPEEFLRS